MLRGARPHALAAVLAVTAAIGCGDEELGQADTQAVATTSLFDTVTADDTSGVTTATAEPDVETPVDTTKTTDAAADTASVPPDVATGTGQADTATGADTAGGADAAVEDTTPVHVPEVVRFIVMGDTGTGSPDQYQVASVLKDKCAADGCDFAILCGDNIYDVGVESLLDAQWQEKFELPYAELDFPFYAVLGNHDNGGYLSQVLGDTFGGAGGEFERGDLQVQYTQISEKFRMPGRTYDFVAGPAHFFALDTNDMVWSFLEDSAGDRAHIQMTTLPGRIDASTKTWRFAMGHHPYRSNGQHGNAGEYEGLEEDVTDLLTAIDLPFLGDFGEELTATVTGDAVKDGLEAIVCGRVDIYFSGHDHNRQWIPPVDGCPGTTLVVSGAGAKVKDFARDETATLFQDDAKEGFFWIEVIDGTLNVEAIDLDGTVQWTQQLQK